MSERLINWLQTASYFEAFLVFLVENLVILTLVVTVGNWLIARNQQRRVALKPVSLSTDEIASAAANVLLNTLVTFAGLLFWRRGIIHFRSDVGIFALLDVLVLTLGMDFLMYLLHRIAHIRALFPLLHEFHHRFDRPRPLTLFALNPVENLAFGGLWLVSISLYNASWLGMSIYLCLNVVFGGVGHLGVEALPGKWSRLPVMRYVAGGSFHAQHHQDIKHNYGFYTLIWDRLFGTIRPDYEENFGRLPNWVEELVAAYDNK
jgi:sterol desaturase/sphingolipid hydroxylase (fatty acid hydroxylase superfamily)